MNLTEKSKELAFLLRHDTEYEFHINGWRTVEDLTSNHGFTIDILDEIIKSDNKGRYEYNDEHTCVRARQGHSVKVDVELSEMTPPAVLYHGTADRFIEQIRQEGIKKMTRNYVQLSADIDTARSVGQRHGKSVVIRIDTETMSKDGIKFYLSRNNVWLTEYVDPKYFY